ncbi:MAG: hypothetical protein ACOZCL_15250 [Bacillota bacterium]
MKKHNVKIMEKGNRITLTFNPILAQKSVRNFDPVNTTPKVHKTKKGKGSYTRKEKNKNRDCDRNTSLCFFNPIKAA